MEIRDDELEHYGRKGMKWYQHIFGKEASATRRRNKSLKKARKTRKKNKEREQKALKKLERDRKRRESILRSPSSLYKHRHEFTRSEIDEALARFDWEQRVQQYSTTRVANAAKIAADFVKIANSAVGGYNTVAAVYNAWVPDSPLPTVVLNPNAKKDGNKK